MPKMNAPLYSLNGGEVSSEALSRLDLERMQFAGSLYSNVLPRVVGSMTFRPGLQYMATLPAGEAHLLEYDYSQGADALPVFSAGEMRIFNETGFFSRDPVSTTITNGDFSSFGGWTDTSTGVATATVSGGQLVLTGANDRRAESSQTINAANQGTVHGLRVKVAHGPVSVAIGSAPSGADILADRVLEDGDHSLSFTPNAAQCYLRVWSDEARESLVDSCQIDGAGEMVLDSPYQDGDFAGIRDAQSIDTVFIACPSFQQRQITRYPTGGWSFSRYKVNDGPFELGKDGIRLAPSTYLGNGSLTSSASYFEPGMVGRLFRLTQAGQQIDETLDGEGQQTGFIRVSGVLESRRFSYTVSGSFSARWELQVALDDGSGQPAAWTVYRSGTGPTSSTARDVDDNTIKFFRFAIEPGDYTSGLVNFVIDYDAGSQDGVCRATEYVSRTEMHMEVLDQFYSLGSTEQWDHTVWSDFDGWPGTVALFGGRLLWEGLEKVYGSVSGNLYSFDDLLEGDEVAINRSLNSGGQSGARWMLPLQRLLAGTDVSEVSVRSSALDEQITAANWHPLDASTQGSYPIRALKIDKDGVFVAGDGESLYRISPNDVENDYASDDLTELHQEIFGGARPVSIAVQRKPDTVVWIVLDDGSARALTYEPKEGVVAWSRIETDGLFKKAAVVRGQNRDSAYFVIDRSGTQTLERLAPLSACRSETDNCLADSFVSFDGSPATSFAVPHLDGRDVTVWADGSIIHDQNNLYTVSNGEVILASAASRVVIGLPYVGRWRSTKLAYGAALGTALHQPKRVSQLGLYFIKTIVGGVRVGRDENNLFQYTMTDEDAPIPASKFFEEFDGQLTSFGGEWSTDSRVFIEMRTPYPCTVAALVMQVKTNDVG